MSSRLSMHKQLANADYGPSIGWISAVQPTIVKVISPDGDFCYAVSQCSPKTLILARDIEDSGTAEDKWNRYRARSDYAFIDIIEGRNEVKPQLGDEGQAQADYELRLCHKAHWYGKKYCAFSWAEGNPAEWWNDPKQWAEFLDIWGPVLLAADYIGLHEYWWPDWEDPRMLGWHAFRYPKWYDKLPTAMRRPIIISECNLDGDVKGPGDIPMAPGKGWRDLYTPEQWAERLVAYERACGPEVVAIESYDFKPTPDWVRFEWCGDAADALRDKILAGGGEGMQIVDLTAECQFNSGLTRTIAQIRGICVHHSGSAAPEANQVAHIQTMTDASYHYLIGRDGKVFQLNGIEEVVWHAADGVYGPSNRGDVAVSFIGLLMDGVRPSAAQFQAFRDLRAMLRAQGIGAGLVSHKQAKPAHDTACPGDWWPLDAPPPAGLTGGVAEPTVPVPPSSEPTTPPADTVLARMEALEGKVALLGDLALGMANSSDGQTEAWKALRRALMDAGL